MLSAAAKQLLCQISNNIFSNVWMGSNSESARSKKSTACVFCHFYSLCRSRWAGEWVHFPIKKDQKDLQLLMRNKPVWHFSFHRLTLLTRCCYFFHCRYLIYLSGMLGEEGGKPGGLMGIRQEGKQASKPQQKPQTWPRVKHDSLVTCQAASGVITLSTMDRISLNCAHPEWRQRANGAHCCGIMGFLIW